MMDLIRSLISGISGGATSEILGLFLNVDEKDKANPRIKSEADELIKQIGDNADSPEEIPSALDGFNFTHKTAKGEVNKQYEAASQE